MYMTIESVEAQILPGTEIETAAAEAVAFSIKHQCKIHFSFNAVNLFVWPGITVDQVLSAYHYCLERGLKSPV